MNIDILEIPWTEGKGQGARGKGQRGEGKGQGARGKGQNAEGRTQKSRRQNSEAN